MTEKSDSNTKKQEVNPVQVIRMGAVAASIWRRRATGGYEYFDFSLSRSWKSHDGKEGYSKSFYASNESQLNKVVSEAAAWIALQQTELVAEPTSIGRFAREAA